MPVSFLLLAAADSAAAVPAAAAAPQKISLLYLLREGGLLMIPLLICSVVLIYVFVERMLVLRRAAKSDPNFMSRIRDAVASGNLQSARSLSRNTPGPVARMIDKGISRIGRPSEHIEKSMESAGKLEIYQMEKNMAVLSTISRIAPMFGFLGTIAGMIVLFFNIQHQGFSLEGIAGGIYTKMITSAVGLIIGLLAYVAYDYLNAQLNKTVNRMEAASVEFLDILQEPGL